MPAGEGSQRGAQRWRWRDGAGNAARPNLTVCIMRIMNSADIVKRLERAGWVLRGVRGSHHIYTHPDKPGHISVPHPKKDLGTGLAHKLLKQAGLK